MGVVRIARDTKFSALALLPATFTFIILAFYGRIEVHELGHALVLLPAYFLGWVTRIEIHTNLLTGVTLWWGQTGKFPLWYRWVVDAAGVAAVATVGGLVVHYVPKLRGMDFGYRAFWMAVGYIFVLSGLWDLAPTNANSDGHDMAVLTTPEVQWVLWWSYAALVGLLTLMLFRDRPRPIRGLRYGR